MAALIQQSRHFRFLVACNTTTKYRQAYPLSIENNALELRNERKRYFNSNRSSIVRIGRENYTRLYLTLLVQPDGSTITVRYDVPQKIIKLPVDISQLGDEEKKLNLLRRKPKEKIVIQEEVEDDFNVDQYSHLWKTKK